MTRFDLLDRRHPLVRWWLLGGVALVWLVSGVLPSRVSAHDERRDEQANTSTPASSRDSPSSSRLAPSPVSTETHAWRKSDVLFEEDSLGAFGGPSFKFTLVNGQPGALLGGRGGIVAGDVFSIGAGAFGLLNSVDADGEVDGEVPSIGLGYAGVVLEGLLFSNYVIHGTAGFLIGGGGVTYQFDGEGRNNREDALFVLDSFVAAELNMTRSIRINAGAGWRQTFGAHLEKLSDRDVAGLTVHLLFKLGYF